jgi:hypothetical protein
MNEELSSDHSPVAKPEREAVEGRLDLRHHHLARSRYRLLNLRDCAAPQTGGDDEPEVNE